MRVLDGLRSVVNSVSDALLCVDMTCATRFWVGSLIVSGAAVRIVSVSGEVMMAVMVTGFAAAGDSDSDRRTSPATIMYGLLGLTARDL